MRHSFSYYIVLVVLKLKSIKKNFSQSPIDYKKIRREDVLHPKGSFFSKRISEIDREADSFITKIPQVTRSSELTIFVNGGAFISGPAQHHWDSVKKISKNTSQDIWMCVYPKAPEKTINTISQNIDSVYETALTEYASSKITLVGDSAGATLITTLIQRLVVKNSDLPKKIILLSPVMDASMTNPEIDTIDKIDPMLSKVGVVSAKTMCAGEMDLKNEAISPLYGSFDKFPDTVLFLAEHDITYPDQLLAAAKMIKSKVNVDMRIGIGMPHIWPLLPVMKEAKSALKDIIDILNN